MSLKTLCLCVYLLSIPFPGCYYFQAASPCSVTISYQQRRECTPLQSIHSGIGDSLLDCHHPITTISKAMAAVYLDDLVLAESGLDCHLSVPPSYMQGKFYVDWSALQGELYSLFVYSQGKEGRYPYVHYFAINIGKEGEIWTGDAIRSYKPPREEGEVTVEIYLQQHHQRARGRTRRQFPIRRYVLEQGLQLVHRMGFVVGNEQQREPREVQCGRENGPYPISYAGYFGPL